MPAALTRFVQACFTAADATVDKAAMMVGKRCSVQSGVCLCYAQVAGTGVLSCFVLSKHLFSVSPGLVYGHFSVILLAQHVCVL